jgi:hypothetical protein
MNGAEQVNRASLNTFSGILLSSLMVILHSFAIELKYKLEYTFPNCLRIIASFLTN